MSALAQAKQLQREATLEWHGKLRAMSRLEAEALGTGPLSRQRVRRLALEHMARYSSMLLRSRAGDPTVNRDETSDLLRLWTAVLAAAEGRAHRGAENDASALWAALTPEARAELVDACLDEWDGESETGGGDVF